MYASRVFTLVACFSTLFLDTSHAESTLQQNLELSEYTCAQFLEDAQSPSNGGRLLKSLMMISWATGYATAFQTNAARADAEAIVLMAATIGTACKTAPEKGVVQVVIEKINRFAATANGGAATNAVAGGTPSSILQGIFKVYNNFDLLQGDLRRLERVDVNKCSTACAADTACQAYSYDKWNRWCFLKSKVTTLTLEPSSLSAIRKELEEPTRSNAETRIEMRVGKHLEGSHVRHDTVSAAECQRQCEADKKCMGYTFLENGRSCDLFNEIVSVSSGGLATSGFKTQTPP